MGYCYCLDRKSCARSCFMRSWKAEDRLIFHKKYIISELTYRGQFYAGVSFLVGPYNKGWGYQPRSKRLQGREPSPHSDAGAAVNFSFLLHLFSYIFSLSPTITNLQLLSLRKFNTFWFVYDLFPLGRLYAPTRTKREPFLSVHVNKREFLFQNPELVMWSCWSRIVICNKNMYTCDDWLLINVAQCTIFWFLWALAVPCSPIQKRYNRMMLLPRSHPIPPLLMPFHQRTRILCSVDWKKWYFKRKGGKYCHSRWWMAPKTRGKACGKLWCDSNKISLVCSPKRLLLIISETLSVRTRYLWYPFSQEGKHVPCMVQL